MSEENGAMHSPEIDQIAAALCKAQAEMAAASPNAKNPHYNSVYADLASIVEAARKPLTDNDISWCQMCWDNALWTYFFHKSGQWLRSKTPILTDRTGPQPYGSGLTYSRRYGFAPMAGVVVHGEDDDGEGATDHTAAPKATPAPAPANNIAYEIALTPGFAATPDELFTEMSDKNLKWYYKTLRSSIVDASKIRYLDTNKAKFRGVLAAIPDMWLLSSTEACREAFNEGDAEAAVLYPLFQEETERRNPPANDPNDLFDEANSELT